MKSKKTELYLSLFVCSALCSCSIKENRMDCPCKLTVDLSECGYDGSVELKMFNDGLFVLEKQILAGEPLAVDIPRKIYSFCALPSSLEPWLEDRTELVAGFGEQFPAVRMYCNPYLDAVCETVNEKVVMHKQYTEIFLDAEGVNLNLFEYELQGEVKGFNILDLSPVEGPFECSMKGDGNIVSARIPRQKGDGLKLTVNGNGRSGTLDLSAFLEDEGYDWEAEDLEDVYIKISALKSYVEIGIEDWDETFVGGAAI